MKIYIVLIFVGTVLLVGCSSSSDCYDDQLQLWNSNSSDNSYKGNEAYWDAVAECDK